MTVPVRDATSTEAPKPQDYRSLVPNNWCPGCGDFGILSAIQSALAQLAIPPYKVAIFSGIGCSGKTPHYLNAYGLHTLHGRVLPVATGAKIASRDLTVLAVGGDGDGYGIGAGYFLHAGRRNLDFTYIVFNNSVYGLTKGQGSPTLPKGLRTKSMPEPAVQDGINPIALAVGAGYTFIARGFALDVRYLTGLIASAIRHRGSSFLDVLQTCPTYNDLYTKDWYTRNSEGAERILKLDATDYDPMVHDPTDPEEIKAKKLQAVAKAYEWGEQIPIGIYYQIQLPTFEDELTAGRPRLQQSPVVDLDHSQRNLEPLLQALH